ncbi:MAG: hypothetical protein IJ856_02500 [Candidatus Methanomethylophilaceae archaeon]|nr:hypothetical protein [Candidatus Methanomethylophilaceae archaeon]
MPTVKVVPSKAGNDEVLECEAICPKKVFAVKDGKLAVVDEKACDLCRACTEHLSEKGGIVVEGDDTTFMFTFETDGSLTARQALDKAVEILNSSATEFGEQIEAL